MFNSAYPVSALFTLFVIDKLSKGGYKRIKLSLKEKKALVSFVSTLPGYVGIYPEWEADDMGLLFIFMGEANARAATLTIESESKFQTGGIGNPQHLVS
jgi:hypothetical protein